MTSTAEYMRDYRRRRPANVREDSQRQQARAMTARLVAKRHRAEWDREYVAECERRGVDPFPPTGRPRQ